MKAAELKAYRIDQLEFVNKVQSMTKMELENKVSYNVAYSPDNTCRGEMRAEVTEKTAPDKFRIVIVMSGIFSTNPDTSKEKLHLETYDALFPYTKSAVSMITAAAGIRPVILPYMDISGKEIYRVEMPRKDKNAPEEN